MGTDFQKPRRRRTKIVATIGPATSSPERLKELLVAGLDVIRLNFSHGTHDEHAAVVREARRIADEMGRPLAILQDLQGPRLRVDRLSGGQATLKPGQRFTLTTKPVMGDDQRVSVNYPRLAVEVSVGQRLLLDDGHIVLRARETTADEVRCVVETGGVLRDHKGINVPGVRLSAPSLTEKDVADLELGVKLGVDYVALSFVRGPEDATAVRKQLARLGASIPIIAKIEKPEAVDAIDGILRAFDGVMVARGDLGVEMGPERVPLLQKEIIRKANEHDKPVITATQMLESMVNSASPTRAEASDVANAILDGTDAVMLSAETSIGAYPLEAVRMMGLIAEQADAIEPGDRLPHSTEPAKAVARAAYGLARDVGAKAIDVFTNSGRTGQLMAKHRPSMPLYAFTTSPDVYNRLCLWWGVTPILLPFKTQTAEMIDHVERMMVELGVARPNERVIVVGSTPLAARGRTNFVKVHTIRRGGGSLTPSPSPSAMARGVEAS